MRGYPSACQAFFLYGTILSIECQLYVFFCHFYWDSYENMFPLWVNTSSLKIKLQIDVDPADIYINDELSLTGGVLQDISGTGGNGTAAGVLGLGLPLMHRGWRDDWWLTGGKQQHREGCNKDMHQCSISSLIYLLKISGVNWSLHGACPYF